MEANHFSSKYESKSEELLSQPQTLIPLLFDSCQSDLMVYTHDMDRRLTYMSDSSWNVCKLDFKKWQKKSFLPMLTEHSWNDVLKSTVDAALSPQQIQMLHCEIWNDEGDKTQLAVWRRLVMNEDSPVGVIGVSQRLGPIAPPLSSVNQCPFDLLTPPEMSVIQLVVDGTLNKSVAVKLGIAIRTVEMRRSKAMHKLGVRSLPELVKLWCMYSTHKSIASLGVVPLPTPVQKPETPE